MYTNAPEPKTESGDFIRATIVGQSYVQIDRVSESISWSEPVHALNWFNTRFMPLYNFYNLVATRSVTKVGGKPLFKGRLTRHLVGDVSDVRSVLLIVRYPSPVNFKNMAENLYFKVVSLLRSMAVKDFTFCLSHAVQEVNVAADIDSSVQYAVHHFRGSADTIGRVQIELEAKNIQMEFASCKSHNLSSGGVSGATTPIPALMDGLILLSATDNSALESLFATAAYRQIIDQTDSSFIGLFRRLM